MIGLRVYWLPRVVVLTGSRLVGVVEWEGNGVLVCVAESGERVVVSAAMVEAGE